MYKKFYGLKAKPFNITPDPHFIYLSECHREALAHLTYGIAERKGFIVITGEVGTGKTTLIHTLIERLDESVKTALIFNPNLTLKDFFHSILAEFGLDVQNPTKANFLIELNNFLIERLSRNENAVLIIDEAQNLSPLILEEIRLLLNLETSRDKLLQVVLSGQPELNRKLELPELRQLKQRISVRYHIPPLNRREAKEYIMVRLKIAGAHDISIFTGRAIDEIFNYSRGIPRLINILCDNSLLAGYATDKRNIDRKIVRECIEDLELKRKSLKKAVKAAARIPGKLPGLRPELGIVVLVILTIFLAGSLWRNTDSYRKILTMLYGKEREFVQVNSPPESTSPSWRGRISQESAQEVEISPSPPLKGAGSGVGKESISQDQYVVVKKNDWLINIILRRYGILSRQNISLVKESNPVIRDMNHIEAGWKIFLPELNDAHSTDDLFSVHIASFRKFADAFVLFSQMEKEGYEAYIIPVDISGKERWYRVTLGRFKDEKMARQYADKLLAGKKFYYAIPLHIEKSEAVEIER